MKDIKVGNQVIPGDKIPFVIAEAGVNHNGDASLAHQLIDAAVPTGADAIKFQTFSPEMLVSPTAGTTPYQRNRAASDDQRTLLEALTLPRSAWSELQAHAHEVGLEFLSTPFDVGSAELLIDLGVPALKVPSGELTNLPFIRALSQLGVPLLISTGMATDQEVAAAVDAAASAPSLALFHCVTAYPAPLEECNLRAIPAMMESYGVPVGWSDHTLGSVSALGAVAVGASLLEKHFTLDRALPGPDHAASLEPNDLADYVRETKALARALGDGVKRRQPCEEDNAPLVRRSWHAAVDLRPGDLATSETVLLLRPEGGIPPAVAIHGRRVTRFVPAGTAITEADLADEQ